MADASPVKWHLAHTSWFFETFVLEPLASGYTTFHPAYRTLYNSYYNAVGDKHPRAERGLISRPSLDDIGRYRAHVDAAMRKLLARKVPARAAARIELGLQHEQQHQELILTDVKHLLSRSPLQPAYQPGRPPAPAPAPRRRTKWVAYDGGLAEFGHAGTGFAFDNETPRHRAYVTPFALASHPVTQGEFAAFIDDGGYRRPELWLAPGWDCVQQRGWTAPLYWQRVDGRWRTFTLHGIVDVDPQTPLAHVSYFEADAFARWARARLPTEFEWELAARDVPVAGNFVESGALNPLALHSGRPRAGRRNSSATCGNGRQAPTRRTRATGLPPGRWASTTASSCATNMCCVGARARARHRTFARRTAILPARRAGSSPACAWPATTPDTRRQRA